jgi:predicted DNA-binding antitoxin AbrB/MazE fold protein
MTQHVNAIYEKGVLKPLEPLDLKDQELVSLSIEKVAENGEGLTHAGSTLFEVLDEVGLVGCVKGAPADLSSNPKHMEGFGKSGR